MAGATSPDNIHVTQTSDDLTPLATPLALIASTVQSAFSARFRGSTGAAQDVIVANEAARNTAIPAPVQGDSVFRNDKGYVEQYFGTYHATTNPGGATVAGWYPITGKSVASEVITYAGIYSAGNPAGRVYAQGGRVYLDGGVVSTSATFNAGTVYTIGTIPAARAPSRNLSFAVTSNNVHAVLTVTTAGTITFVMSVAFTGLLNLSLAGPSWPIGSLG